MKDRQAKSSPRVRAHRTSAGQSRREDIAVPQPTTSRSPVPDLVVIFRGPPPVDVVLAVERLIGVGYRAFEVSLTAPEAIEAIRKLAEAFGDEVLIGAGTVLSVDDTLKVRDAGAQMVLSPVTNERVISTAKSSGMLAIPGVYTPTEAVTAYSMGADVVKLFPAGSAGVDYFRLMREPLPHIPFLVTGGVDATLARQFLKQGAVAVGVGHKLLGGSALEERNWERLEQQASSYRSIARGESPQAEDGGTATIT